MTKTPRRTPPAAPLKLFAAASSLILTAGSACAEASEAAQPTGAEPVAHARGEKCASLLDMKLPHTKITAAVEMAAGSFVPSSGPTVTDLPAFCRLTATILPTTNSHINVELWMPTEWNAKYLGTGNGGGGGAIRYNDLAIGLRRGFAVANTDLGTSPDGVTSVIGQMEKIIDYGHRSTHLMTTFSKAILKEFYANDPSHSYFYGCSTGGAQGIHEALRYPEDYDGIIVGAMGHNRVPAHVAGLWAYAATQRDETTYLTPETRQVWADEVMSKCDPLDGLTDGVIGRPDLCTVDPAEAQCRAGAGTDCLSAGQVEALRKIYAGPRHAETGEQIYPGFLRGTELSFTAEPPSPTAAAAGGNFPFQWLWGTDWDWRSFDFGSDVDIMRNALDFALDATSGDLHAFKARGGKMILFQGLADPIAAPAETLNYLLSVEEAMPGQSDAFMKLFHAPGMAHCRRGAGPNVFGNFAVGFPQHGDDPSQDLLAAMEEWVENGRAPDQIIATKYVGNEPTGAVERTMPLCSWPKVSRYNGTGDPSSSDSFACVEP